MNTLSIVYFSGSGHTAVMAEAVARGARSVPGGPMETRRGLKCKFPPRKLPPALT